jgi:hypothetical protein
VVVEAFEVVEEVVELELTADEETADKMAEDGG